MCQTVPLRSDTAGAVQGAGKPFYVLLPTAPGRSRIAGNKLIPGRLVHTPTQKQMDTPDTSGTESPALQAVIKAGHGVLGQLRQRDIPDSRRDMTVNQIAVSAHGVAAPSALILTKPPVTPLTHSEIILTVHGNHLLFANATIPQKERNSYCFSEYIFPYSNSELLPAVRAEKTRPDRYVSARIRCCFSGL